MNLLARVSVGLLLALQVGACGIIGPSTYDGPGGSGEAEVINESDAQLTVSLGMANASDVETTVDAMSTDVITNLNGSIGTGPQICTETVSLRVERTDDGRVVLDHAMCMPGDWESTVVGQYETLFSLRISQEMVDAAAMP